MDILTYLKLDTTEFEQGVTRTKQAFAALANAAAGASDAAAGSGGALLQSADASGAAAAALDSTAAAGTSASQALEKVAPAAETAAAGLGKVTAANAAASDTHSRAIRGLGALSAAQGLLSGSATGAAAGAMSLASSLRALGVAAATPVAIIAAIAAGVLLLSKAMADAQAKAAQMRDALQIDKAQAGVDKLRAGYGRLTAELGAAVGHMRELRALSAQGADINFEKQIAALELSRKRALSALSPSDDAGAKKVNMDYDRQRANLELERESAGNTAAAAEMRRQQSENAAAIADRRQSLEAAMAAAASAAGRSQLMSQQADALQARGVLGDGSGISDKILGAFSGVSGAVQRGQQAKWLTERADKWTGVAQENLDMAQRIREEIAELEHKNTVLEKQAGLYEQRNEVVAIRQTAAAITLPDAPLKETAARRAELQIASDRLTRIGGIMAPGAGGANLEDYASKQLTETKAMRRLLERMASPASTSAATWG